MVTAGRKNKHQELFVGGAAGRKSTEKLWLKVNTERETKRTDTIPGRKADGRDETLWLSVQVSYKGLC